MVLAWLREQLNICRTSDASRVTEINEIRKNILGYNTQRILFIGELIQTS